MVITSTGRKLQGRQTPLKKQAKYSNILAMTNHGFRIGSISLNNPLIMAPMAGITNTPFRRMVKEQGAALTVTEMVSAAGLFLRGARTWKLLETFPGERPFSVQIFGNRPEWMARAAVLAAEAGADIIDLNMGCPARKVVNHGGGAALLKDFKTIANILTEIRLVYKGPLTVKTRAGWRPGEGEVLDLVPILIEAKVDAVTLHPRFAVQRFSGQADWKVIARLVEKFPGPVIGNGDITHPRQVLTMMKTTGCAGVMIGRAAMGNPWFFSQALNLLTGRPITSPDLPTRRLVALRHARLLGELVGAHQAAYMLRSVLMWYTKGWPDSTSFRQSINQERNFDRVLELLDSYCHRLISQGPLVIPEAA